MALDSVSLPDLGKVLRSDHRFSKGQPPTIIGKADEQSRMPSPNASALIKRELEGHRLHYGTRKNSP